MPAAVPIHITAAQRRYLRRVQLKAKSRRAWVRATALSMLADGQRAGQVARNLGVCLNTVTNWKRRWNQGGPFRLEDSRHPGRPPKLTRRYLRLLEEAVDRGPRRYGYLFTVWSSARLAAHLEKKTGIALGTKQLRKWLKKLEFVYRRPKHTLKSRQNPREVRRAKKRLETLKKGPGAQGPDTNSGSRTKPTFTCIRT